jgi:hypothetical protein
MKHQESTFSPERYLPFYTQVLTDIKYVKYGVFPDFDESKISRPPINKLRQVMEKDVNAGKDEEKLELVVKDIISHRFQSNLVKFKMLQQQEILRGMATGGIAPEEAILLLLDQTSGDELEDKVLSKGKVSPQSMEELYRFYSRIGDNIERLLQRRPVRLEGEKKGEPPLFRE